MSRQLQFNLIKTLLLLVLIVLAHVPVVDELAESYTEQGIKRTLVTYAVSRGLNGVISVAQGTELALAPAGVGVTLTPGEILDPINDLVERFSWVVLASGTSLGIQRLFLEMSASRSLSVLFSLSAFVVILLIWFYRPVEPEKAKYARYAIKLFLLLALFRFSVPVIAVINEALYLHFLQPQYQQAQLEIEGTTEKIQVINQAEVMPNTEKKNILEKAEDWLNQAQTSLDVSRRIEALKTAASEMSEQLINMIVVFVIQTIIFPLVFLWGVIKLGKVLLTSARI